MADLRKRVGRRIQQLRKAAGLTQPQLADRMRGNYKYLGYVEQGRKDIRLSTIDAIARALRVQPYQLLVAGDPAGAEPTLLRDPTVLKALRRTDPKARALVMDLMDNILRWSAERKPKRGP